MKAYERFKLGDRVRLTPFGREQFPRLFQLGVVEDFHWEDPELIYIRVGGNKTLTIYHETYWEFDA